MKSFQELAAIYRQEHQSKINKLMHYIGIPAIIFGLFIVLNWVNLDFGTVWKVSFSWLILIAAAIYYFWLGSYKLAAVTTIVMIVLLLIAAWAAGPYPTGFGIMLFLIFFFGGWIFLFVGQGMEKSKARMMRNLWQILIAPLFLIDELMLVCGLSSDLNKGQHTAAQPQRPRPQPRPTQSHEHKDNPDDDRQG